MTQSHSSSGEFITAELLHELVPVIQAQGTQHHSQAEIEQAKLRLYRAAYPLLVDIAAREYRRRQQWSSHSSMDDLIQDGSIGFFKALSGFDLAAMGASATHYLGQWMLVAMRRGAESLDHDFQVGQDQGQKFRRIRAIRARLSNELGRDASDDEVIAASSGDGRLYASAMLGKKSRSGSGAELTDKDLDDERAYRERVGMLDRLDAASADPDQWAPEPISDTPEPGDVVADMDAIGHMQVLVRAVIRQLKFDEFQTDVIERHYGLSPYSEPQSLRSISRDLEVNRDRIGRVIRQFNEALKRPGGVLFSLLDQMSSDDREALDVGWLWEKLVPWTSTVDDADE